MIVAVLLWFVLFLDLIWNWTGPIQCGWAFLFRLVNRYIFKLLTRFGRQRKWFLKNPLNCVALAGWKISTIQQYLSGFTDTIIPRGAPGQEKKLRTCYERLWNLDCGKKLDRLQRYHGSTIRLGIFWSHNWDSLYVSLANHKTRPPS